MSSDNTELFETTGVPFYSEIYCKGGKRVFDIVVTVLTLPFIVPIIGIMAILVALDGGNPFYSQDRIGKNGRIYRMWKLRTVVKDANACLESQQRHECGGGQNLVDEHRLTRIGRFLTKSSIDELPQFLNVLIGDMSVVGRRPMKVSQKDGYPGEDYYDLRPGITGLWRIAAQNHMPPTECAIYDFHYNRTLSLSGDLTILAASVKAVLRA